MARSGTAPCGTFASTSVKKADALVSQALAELEGFGERAETLKELARFLVERKK